MGLPEHQRILPHVQLSEQGLRELEIWLRQRLGAGGSGWQFNIQNKGGFGYVRFFDAFDLDTFPTPPSPLANGGSWGGVFEDDSGQGLLVGSTTVVYILSKEVVTIEADTDLTMSAYAGDTTIILGPDTRSLKVLDHNLDPVLKMSNGSPDLHLATGANIILDL